MDRKPAIHTIEYLKTPSKIKDIDDEVPDVVEKLRDKAKPIIEQDRNEYKKIYDVITAYVADKQLFISNAWQITGLDYKCESLADYHYDIYCSRPLEHANRLTNSIYKSLEADNIPDQNKELLVMNTVSKNEEFTIMYNGRFMAKIYALQKDRPKGQSLDISKLIKPYLYRKTRYLPPDIEIIEVYQKIYNGDVNALIFERKLIEMIHLEEKRIKGGSEEVNLASEEDEIPYDAGCKTCGSIFGGSDIIPDIPDIPHSEFLDDIKNIPKTCYERKKDELEMIKIGVLRDFLTSRKDCVLIGALAVDWLNLGKNICPKFDRLQIISTTPAVKLQNELAMFLRALGKNYEINMGESLDLLIPKDFRTKKIIFSISIKTDLGIKEKAFIEYFNSTEFEIIPCQLHLDILIAARPVLLRFLFIDLWISKFIFGLKKMDMLNFTKKTERLWGLIHDCLKMKDKVDGVLGEYYDYTVKKREKLLERDTFFAPYFAHQYLIRNHKLREI